MSTGQHRRPVPAQAAAAARVRWVEALLEAVGLGIFMVSACVATALVEHPGSPLHGVLDPWRDAPVLRRALIGGAMGMTAIAIVYSPIGRRSGAHLNPSVTLAYWVLGRIATLDAITYALLQVAGGVGGVAIAAQLLGPAIADPSVNWVVTTPGPAGALAAFAGEWAISFALMLAVLACSADARTERWTGFLAGFLVALWIAIEAPLSGMSMNPARTIASAVFAGNWPAAWVYFLAPPLAMVTAALLHRRRGVEGCAKLRHDTSIPCVFCQHRAAAASPVTPFP